jgi:hypothetical protein
MAASFDDLLGEMTREQVLADLIEIAKATGLDVSAFEPGEKIWMVMVIFAEWIAQAWNRLILPALKSRFLAYAYGRWLDLLAWTQYNRIRFAQTFAGGTLTVENRGPTPTTIKPRSIRVRCTTTGKTYRNASGGFLGAYVGGGGYPTIDLAFVADEAGAASSVPVGGIPGYPTKPTAAPVAGLYVQANTSAWLGTELEPDERLKERCRTASAALSPGGPVLAYTAAALDPRGTWERSSLPVPADCPTVVAIARARFVPGGNATGAVYLATDSGPAAGDDVTEGTDVFWANAVIQLLVVPGGITVTVQRATEKNLTWGTITLYVRRGARVTAAEAVATATANLVTWLATYPIGGISKIPGSSGHLYAEHVLAELQRGPGVFGCDAPGIVDVTLAVSEVVTAGYTIQALIR